MPKIEHMEQNQSVSGKRSASDCEDDLEVSNKRQKSLEPFNNSILSNPTPAQLDDKITQDMPGDVSTVATNTGEEALESSDAKNPIDIEVNYYPPGQLERTNDKTARQDKPSDVSTVATNPSEESLESSDVEVLKSPCARDPSDIEVNYYPPGQDHCYN